MYGCRDLALSPHGEYWRQMRKICVTQLLSLNRVHSFHSLREEEVMGWIEKIRRASLDSAPINLGDLFVHLSSNIISRCTLGRKYEGQDNIRRFGELASHDGDGYHSRQYQSNFTGFFLSSVSVLLPSPFPSLSLLTRCIFCAFKLQDMLLAGTDSISSIMEWAMAELMKNSTTMQKAQEEVRTVVGAKSRIDQDDIDQMDYLKCVVKETLRLHPPAPFLIPRESTESAKLGGYDIPPKTRVLINAWAIQRDPDLWDRPEEFLPDRFANLPVDFKGQDFQFIPFGAGRRGCPGISLSVIEVEYVLANLLFWFDWKLPGGVGKDLDMISDTFGLVVRKKVVLELVPVVHSPDLSSNL
ncbi:hypothetical protein RHGRI_024430 [Rhododendron griersonianum]|uniref:Cytochrome P450 71A1 n=1 Tax=Rhododendron griersonianum TaxID=479676 RepID=A0AAV6J766_9ERIC|nr:hypothetical protein RHGRI_024430 [Rhododendron griersonianum]